MSSIESSTYSRHSECLQESACASGKTDLLRTECCDRGRMGQGNKDSLLRYCRENNRVCRVESGVRDQFVDGGIFIEALPVLR